MTGWNIVCWTFIGVVGGALVATLTGEDLWRVMGIAFGLGLAAFVDVSGPLSRAFTRRRS